MAVFRTVKNENYTVMCNHHLTNKSLSLKAKGLLSLILALPDNWNYNTRGLASCSKDGVDSTGNALKELEEQGYIIRRQLRGNDGRIYDTEYTVYEIPQKKPDPTSPDCKVRRWICGQSYNPSPSHPPSPWKSSQSFPWTGREKITNFSLPTGKNHEHFTLRVIF